MKKVWTSMFSVLLMLTIIFGGIQPTQAAETKKLETGNYQTVLDVTDWGETKEVSEGLKVSPRAGLVVLNNGALSAMQLQVTGYSQYDAIYMVKQDAALAEIDLSDGGKIGAWTEITNYEKLKENGYVDESLNDSFVKLTPDEGSVNEALDTATFTLNSWSGYAFDCTEKVGLIGCLKREMTTLSAQCNSITLKANLDLTKSTQLASCIANGITDLDLNMDINSWQYSVGVTIPESDSGYNTSVESTSPNTLKDSATTKVTYEIDGDKLVAKIYLTDTFKTAGTEVYEIASRDISAVKNNDRSYKAYLAGNGGVAWKDENLYDAENGCITLSFTTLELLYGKDIKFYVSSMGNRYYQTANICLSEYDYGPVVIENEDFGIQYQNRYKTLIGNVQLKASLNTDNAAIENIKKVCGEGDYKVYTLGLEKNGEAYTPITDGTILIPIPEDWEVDEAKFYAAATYINESGTMSTYSTFPTVLKVQNINGRNYLVCYRTPEKVLQGGSIAIGQVKQKQDVTKLEEGLYKVEAGFIKAGTDAETSMANGTLDSNAYLKVDAKGNKTVYLNFHGLDMGGGGIAYMGAIWNKDDSDVTYYDYETDASGALIESAGFDPITEFPCVKAVKIELSDSTWDANNLNYQFKVIPPGMGSGMDYNYVYTHPIDADLVFFSTEKVDEAAVQIPTYQKAVLRKAIDKAGRYDEALYGSDSWAVLKAALEDGKAYYNGLGDKDAGTDATISDTIKAKADAIETAIANLKENIELEDTRTALKAVIDEASKVEQGDKTDSAFQTLQAAISTAQAEYAKSNTTVDALKAAAETLKAAVDTFNNSGTASELDKNNLKPGDYTVHIDMLNAANPSQASMSDKAVDHTAKLTVEEDGKYYITVNFKGMTIPLAGQEFFGYLKELYYYADGYQIGGSAGLGIQGKLLPATVLSTIKDKDGNPATDDFNVDADGKVLYEYPEALRFELVPTALNSEQGYVALQVFVPVMASISIDSGTQNVLMRVDWSSLAVDTTAADKAAAQTVTDQIGALGDITSLDQKEAVTAARAAYDALTDAQKAYVSADTLKVLAAAEDSIKKLEDEAAAEQADRDAAAKVDAQIAALPTVNALTLDDQAAVTEARAAYNALNERAQGYVTSLETLEAAEAQIEVLKAEAADEAVAQTIVDQINALGEITDLSQADKVAAARAAYDGLTEAQKAYVSEDALQVLASAETKIAELQAAKEEADKAAAQVVVDQINTLGEITSLDQEAEVVSAREAYNALTADQKALVSEEALNALIQAENTILDLKQQVVDQEKADAVTEAIEALKAADELTLDDKAAVEAARAAYSALSADQKALISDDILKVLTDAEERIAELVAAANPQTEDQDNNQNQQQNVGGSKLPQNSLTGNKQTAGTGNVGTGVTGTDTAAVSALGLVALAGALAFARKARKDN